ncbi:MAG: hypothetical protein JRF33_00345 [Deltaproteobacteria bacterium]|nr:hypothetical protein [Deltaproteobacteria bacterium]
MSGKNGLRFRRTHLGVLALAGILLVGASSVLGALDRLILVLLPALLVVAAPAHLFRLWLSGRRLAPLQELFDRLKTESRIKQIEAEQGLRIIARFPIREAVTGVIIWPLGALGIFFATDFLVGMSSWQALIVIVLGVVVGWIDALLVYHAGMRFLDPIRSELESNLDPAALARQPAQRLTFQLIVSVLVVLVLGLGMVSLVWFGLMRDSKAEQILASHRASFLAAVRSMPPGLSDPVRLADALRDAGDDSGLGLDLVVIDSKGQVVAGAQPLTPYRDWLKLIAENGASEWSDLQSPFLFMARRMSPEHLLVWVAEMDVVHQAMGTKRWRAMLGVLLTALACLVLGASVVRTGLSPLGALSERIRSYHGDDVPAPAPGLGELPVLSQAVEDFATAVRNTLKTGRQAVGGLMIEHRQMKNKVIGVTNAATLRGEMAEQTAASVFEMRSSIRSVTEQVRSLKEASTDGSSALFEIDQSVREVASSAESLQGVADVVAKTFRQVDGTMVQVIMDVDELALQAEKASTSIAIMDDAIREVESNTSETHRLSQEVSEIAALGADSVRETITGIQEIKSVTQEAREVINRLGGEMAAVGKILTVISDVAEQTNLLALNAAIIAAAAGEHGKGFAVLADEIKKLADRTASSTKEIAILIKSVQTESSRAVDAIERGFGSVQRGEGLANNAGEALKQILTSVRRVNQMADDIAGSTAEHTNTSRIISISMGEIGSMVRNIRQTMGEQEEKNQRMRLSSEQMQEDARFVVRSAHEQSQAVSAVSRNMERMNEMVGFISKAMDEQSQGVEHVTRTTEQLRDAFLSEMSQLSDLEQNAELIHDHTKQLAEQLERFGGVRRRGK